MKLKTICVGELSEFGDSDLYRDADNQPISRLRLHSQYRNPRAEADDPALILAVEEGRIAGYIGLLPDLWKGEKIYWNSGWWVARGYGHMAMPLFLSFLKAGRERIVLTDLTPHTAKILRKLRFFRFREMTPGIRCHLNSDAASLLPARYPWMKSLSGLLSAGDQLVNTFWKTIRRTYDLKLPDHMHLEKLDRLYEKDDRFIRSRQSDDPVGRTAGEINWIYGHPWVSRGKDDGRYYFTTAAPDFETALYRISINEEVAAIISFKLINGSLTTPFCYYTPEAMAYAGQFICYHAEALQCKNYSTFQDSMVKWLRTHRTPFLFTRPLTRTFAYHQCLEHLIDDDFNLQDGAGDMAFC